MTLKMNDLRDSEDDEYATLHEIESKTDQLVSLARRKNPNDKAMSDFFQALSI